MNANERRMAIWRTLCAHRHVTIAYLASLYQVSRTTIKEDITVMSLAYPIVTARGYKGGVSLADWYVPDEQVLTPQQLQLLVRLRRTLTGNDAYIMESIISQLSNLP